MGAVLRSSMVSFHGFSVALVVQLDALQGIQDNRFMLDRPDESMKLSMRFPEEKFTSNHSDHIGVETPLPIGHGMGNASMHGVVENGTIAWRLTESLMSPVLYTMVLCNNLQPPGTLISGYVGCLPHSGGCFMASPIPSPSCSLGLMSVNKLMEAHIERMTINFTNLNATRWNAEWGELVPPEDTVATRSLPRKLPSSGVWVAVLHDKTNITLHDGCDAGRKALGLKNGADEEGALSFACSQHSIGGWQNSASTRVPCELVRLGLFMIIAILAQGSW